MKKKLFVFVALISLLLTGCQAGSHETAPSDTSHGQESEASAKASLYVPDIQFFGALAYGNGNGARTENGFYTIERQTAEYGTLRYIDFSTKTSFPVCSRPECTHQDESCTSYFNWYGAFPFLAASSEHLIFVMPNGGNAFPNLQIADLNGANRKTIHTFTAQENIQLGIACSEESVYMVRKTIDDLAVKTDLCEISLNDGKVTRSIPLPPGDSFICGAQGQYLIVSCYSLPENGELYSDSQTNTFMCFDMASGTSIHQMELPLRTPAGVVQNIVEGTVLYSYSPADDMLSQIDLKTAAAVGKTGPVWNNKIQMGQLDSVLDGKVLCSEFFEGSDELMCAWVDISTGEKSELTLMGEYGKGSGRTFPVIPMFSVGDEILVVNNCETKEMLLANGMPAGLLIPNFAFISKTDYMANAANYEEIER